MYLDDLCSEVRGQYSGRLLICGSARCIWDDLSLYQFGEREGVASIVFDGDVMVVNDIGMHLGCPIHHWYSNDWEMLPRWVAARRPLSAVTDVNILTHSCYGGADYVWPWHGGGTSGLNAVFTALALGYSEITLAGIPLDDAGHYFDPPWQRTNFTNEVPSDNEEIKYWSKAAKESFQGKVKSLSGRTKAILNPDGH